jgi:hypothetical protein
LEKPKLEMYYHKQTDSTWVNDPDWEKRSKTESMGYGSINLDTDNIFKVKSVMKGFYLIKNNPYKILSAASEVLKD